MEGKKGGFSLSSAVSAKRGGEQQGPAPRKIPKVGESVDGHASQPHIPPSYRARMGGARMKAEAPRQQNQSRPQSNAPVNLCACPGK